MIALRRFSKLTVFSTLFLIFAGAMVKSTDSGLAVPDWPLSYGMFFPPMVGGVFYEHGHRQIAFVVACFTLLLAIWLHFKDSRQWLKIVGYWALFAVVAQAILGGITVKFLLPTPISVSHALLAQTFFLITIFIAYALSIERSKRNEEEEFSSKFYKSCVVLLFCIYMQLLLGALMRHTESGLAVYDFPTMGGLWWPNLEQLLINVNDWRFDNGFDAVEKSNLVYHLLHRVGAVGVLIALIYLNFQAMVNMYADKERILKTIFCLDALVFVQVCLGIASIYTLKAPVVTSIHVVLGAGILGMSFLILLRAAPISIKKFHILYG